MIFRKFKKIFFWRVIGKLNIKKLKNEIFKTIFRLDRPKRAFSLFSAIALIFFGGLFGCAHAITRAEFAADLWSALEYKEPSERRLPPDVPPTHAAASAIGGAARYGLISSEEPFWPDDEINRHEAVKMALEMMGWGFEISMYDSLSELPDFGGSGDSVFFLAAEMRPQAPQNVLIDGSLPLAASASDEIISWAKQCKRYVRWNRVFSFGGTDLTLFRQGVARPGEPNRPGDGSPIGGECEPLFISAIAVDPANVDAHIAFSAPHQRPRAVPSVFSSAYDALCVVNGGFFYETRPIGSMLIDGQHAGKPIIGRSGIGWNNADGTIVFGRAGARMGAHVGRGFTEIANFNVPPKPNEASFYTSGVTLSSIGSPADALRIIAKDGRVVELRTDPSDHWIPEGHVMLIARGRAREQLGAPSVGDAFSLETAWETRSFSSCTDLIQGGPMLIRGGVFSEDPESFKNDITGQRHPRTIVGTDGRRVIWAVIDGRSAIHSRGATIAETRYIAQALGMSTALNLDGGGSSQMIWRGVMTNSPSDGRERALPYAVVMKPRGAEMIWRAPAEEESTWDFAVPDAGANEDDPFLKLYKSVFNE